MTHSEEKERRRFKRIKKTVYGQCRLYNTTASWVSVIVQDISESGMSIYTIKKCAIGNMLEIKLTTFMKTQGISIIGKVVGCEKKPEGKGCVVRISIVRINEQDKVAFKELIQIFLKATKKEQ